MSTMEKIFLSTNVLFEFPFIMEDEEVITESQTSCTSSEGYDNQSTNIEHNITKQTLELTRRSQNGRSNVIVVTRKELDILKKPSSYLNDVIIDFYLQW